MAWTDNHCHLEPETADDQIAEAAAGGVERLICVGTSLHSSQVAIRLAESYPSVWATAGVHPHDADGGVDGIAELLTHPRVVAVGECGLDYHYDHSPRPEQRSVFAEQIALAHSTAQALVIHSREAWDDTFSILDSEGVPAHTVFHCFTGGPSEAEEALRRGCHLSFSGIVTFPSAPDLREAARICPLERLMVETDSPYLAPVPHRGKKNRPLHVTHVGEMIASLKGIPVEQVARATWHTTERFYRLDE